MKLVRIIVLSGLLFLTACSSGAGLSLDELLEEAKLDVIPAAKEYEEYGGVVLYENTHTEFALDGDWEIYRKQYYEIAFVYYNDKAANMLTESIYLDKSIKLIDFAGKTIKPDGTELILTKEDLHKDKVLDDYIDFSDEESVKFTFPGVEPGSVLQYKYEIAIFDNFNLNDIWYLQTSYPKLLSRYSVQIPNIFLESDINWNYYAMNFELERPGVIKDLMNSNSRKDRNNTYSWELRNVEALPDEPDSEPYKDVAKYVILGVQRDNWNELTKNYWSLIYDRFDYRSHEIKQLAESIVANAKTERDSIEAIYQYTQRKYRYVAISIGESGYIPHYSDEIIKNKYGDCKDMTVLNVVLLKSLGIDAKPALVKTRSSGRFHQGIIRMNFNHMITKVETKDGKIYWLDSIGSSCPLDEIYSSIEGATPLVINEDGTSSIDLIPASTNRDNRFSRSTSLEVDENGNVKGHSVLTFTGEENVLFRSAFKDATEKDIKKFTEKYANSVVGDIDITNITYDSVSIINDNFNLEFDFEIENYAINTNNLLILNPFIFGNRSNLDRYRDEKRTLNLVFDYAKTISDEVEVTFPEDKLSFSNADNGYSEKYNFGKVVFTSGIPQNNTIRFTRRVDLTERIIYPKEYEQYRSYLKSINKYNNVNLTLTMK